MQGISQLTGPRGIAINDDSIFVGSGYNTQHMIMRFDMTGNLLESYTGVNFPGSIVFDSNGNMLASNMNGDKISRFQRND